MGLCKRGCMARNGKQPKYHRKATDCPYYRADHPVAAAAPQPPAEGASSPPDVAKPSPPPATPSPDTPFKRLGRRLGFRRQEEGAARDPEAAAQGPSDLEEKGVDEEHAARWVQSLINMFKMGLDWGADLLNVPPPADEPYRLRELEQDQIGDLSKEIVTKTMLSLGFKTQARAHHFIDMTAFGTALFGVVKETGSWGVKTTYIVQDRLRSGRTITGRILTDEEKAAALERKKAKANAPAGGLLGRLRQRRLQREVKKDDPAALPPPAAPVAPNPGDIPP